MHSMTLYDAMIEDDGCECWIDVFGRGMVHFTFTKESGDTVWREYTSAGLVHEHWGVMTSVQRELAKMPVWEPLGERWEF